MRLIFGLINGAKELPHFAVTPYIHFIVAKTTDIKGYGLGFAWGFWSIYGCVAKGLPKDYPTFKVIK